MEVLKNPIRVNRYSESDNLVTSRRTFELCKHPFDRVLLDLLSKRNQPAFFAGNLFSSQEGKLLFGDFLLNKERKTKRGLQIEKVYLGNNLLQHPRDFIPFISDSSIKGDKRLSFRITERNKKKREKRN
jgi:hypothetical protein